MSTPNKILSGVLVVIVLVFGYQFVKPKKTETAKVGVSDDAKNYTSKKQEKEEGSVTVVATPSKLKIGEKPVFELAFDTHSVDLSFDVLKSIDLVDDKGRIYKGTLWDGPGPGGHHRQGSLSFGRVLEDTKYIELVIINVAKVPERRFRWNL